MSGFHQLTLPGFPVRIVVSAVWEGPDKPCTVRATVDAPSDLYATQWSGVDTTGIMTWRELEGAMETLLGAVMDDVLPPTTAAVVESSTTLADPQ